MLTIRTKLSLGYTLVFGAMLAGFAFLVYRSSQDAERSKLDAHLEGQAERLQSEIEEQFDERQFPVAQDLVSIRAEGLIDLHVQVFDSAGSTVLSDSLLPPPTRTAITGILHGSPLRQDILLNGERYRTLLAPVEVGGKTVAALQLASSTVEADASLARLRFLFLISIPAALLLALVASSFVTRRAFQPIRSMIETARRVSANNLDARLELPRIHDEIRLLGETLNTMMERISGAFDRQRQFIADASHELRTPLTVIFSELEFIQRRTTDEPTSESIRTSLLELERLSRMTEGMLMLARLDASRLTLKREVFRLDELLLECVQLLKTLFSQKHLAIHLHIGEAVEVKADRDKLKSAFINLLDNAAKYSSDGGTVGVSLRMNGTASVRVEISDTGCGIAAADIPHVFKRFYRPASARAESSGSGLGLAIVEEVVNMHGGTVTARSTPGEGSIFVIELPL